LRVVFHSSSSSSSRSPGVWKTWSPLTPFERGGEAPMGNVGVSVLLCFASAWTSAMRLPCASSSRTASRSQPRALAQGCRNTGVAAAFLKSDDLCVGVGVSEHNAFGFGVVNDPSSLRLCASSDRCAVDVQFLGVAANTDAAANQMTFKRRLASTTRYTGFSSCISTQSRARSMSMLTTGQVPQRTSILPPANPLPLESSRL
jgi:hypothetical protein